MAQQIYKDLEMDTLEMLYHERKAEREKAYLAKSRKKCYRKKGTVDRRHQIEKSYADFKEKMLEAAY